MILSTIPAFCLQKALNSTGFIRYSGKPGSHVPNAENPNAFLSIPECPCSRAPWPGRAEISKNEGGGSYLEFAISDTFQDFRRRPSLRPGAESTFVTFRALENDHFHQVL